MHTVPRIREIMQETTYSVPPEMDVFEALDLLSAKRLSGIPVIDGENRLVGFLTEKDCLRIQVIAHQYNMTGRTVRDIMSSIQQSLHPENDVLTAAMIFLGCNFPALPVIDDAILIGNVTRRDMVLTIQRWHRDRGIDFKNEKAFVILTQNPSSIGDLQELAGRTSKEQLAAVLGGRHSGK